MINFRSLRGRQEPAEDPREQLRKVLTAHLQTVVVCEACALTTRDLATEVKRGGVPPKEDLQKTVDEAERVLAELASVKAELDRVLSELR